jgi:DNA polymerase I-like protein with 3'-5' exonuclease and polymerase domains
MFGGYKGYFNSKKKLDNKRKYQRGRLSYQDSANKIISNKFFNPTTGMTISHDMRLAVVSPTHSYMPQKEDVTIVSYNYSIGFVKTILSKLNGIIAVDIETRGTQAHNPDCIIVGIGIASDTEIIYFDFATNGLEVNQLVLNFLASYNEGMVGHNVFFDGAFLQRDSGKWLDWRYDTYGLYKQLATEGYAGQKWGLKDAQIQLLNYDMKGDVELDEWLVHNGYISDIKLNKTDGYVYVKDREGKGERWCRARKSEMWRAPAEILGYYCGVDAASTYQLLTECFLPSIKNEPYEESFLEYHSLFMDNVRLHVDQQLSGITIDKQMLEEHHTYLLENISKHYDNFINHPEIRPYATEYNQIVIDELKQKEPIKYKKVKWPKEPAKLKKDGSVSKAWIKYQEKINLLNEQGPQLTAHWISWSEKMKKAKVTEHLNSNSSQQMQWLFYEKLGYEVLIRTESDQPSTGASALPGFGEVGQLLKKQKDDVKEEGYVKACLENLIDGRLHPQFRMPGTLTCRLAGSGGINLQQIPKSRRYLECWYPINDKVWIDFDFSALEQVVMAELSKDESLYSLYGPGAKANDVYLFNAALMAQRFGVKLFQPILDEGYDPFNPDPEAIKRCKKKHKNLRAISKVASLGKSYGMGWGKFKLNMKLQGVEMTEREARAVIDGLDKVYAGVKEYNNYLLKEYDMNNGYVLNGVGRPVGVAKDYIKDIVNRVVQSTGHDVLMLWIQIYSKMLDEAGINWNGIVLDFHDQSIIECDKKDMDKVIQILHVDSLNELNKQLGGVIPLKLDGGQIKTLADAKCEE